MCIHTNTHKHVVCGDVIEWWLINKSLMKLKGVPQTSYREHQGASGDNWGRPVMWIPELSDPITPCLTILSRRASSM